MPEFYDGNEYRVWIDSKLQINMGKNLGDFLDAFIINSRASTLDRDLHVNGPEMVISGGDILTISDLILRSP